MALFDIFLINGKQYNNLICNILHLRLLLHVTR